MLVIRYAVSSGLDVSGSRKELRRIHEAILALAAAGKGSHVVEASTAEDPDPYALLLGRMTVSIDVGPVRISVRGDREVRIDGDAEYLLRLASFFAVPVD